MAKTLIIIGLLFLIFVAVAILAFFYFFSSAFRAPSATGSEIKVGNKVFRVEVANTIAKRTLGLSGRENLGEDEGMFFVFGKPDDYGFWMKGMKFPIDIVWIKSVSSSQAPPGNSWTGKVVGFSENAEPEPGTALWNLKIYYPPEPVDGVLEINAGAVKRSGIVPGDIVSRNFLTLL